MWLSGNQLQTSGQGGSIGLTTLFHSDKALTFILIIGSGRNGETCGYKNKELSKVTEKLAGGTGYFSSSLELRQMTLKCGVGDVSIQRTVLHLNMNDKFISHEEAQKKIALSMHHLFVDGTE